MKARGFTLVELITVMVVIGIMAVAALPRFLDNNVFDARGFFDETKSLLRYAQKASVAQRRTVCVALSANGVALTIAGAANANVCNTPLTSPMSPDPTQRPIRAGLVASVATFQFSSLGGTDQPADVSIAIANAAGTITVDRTTGYVY